MILFTSLFVWSMFTQKHMDILAQAIQAHQSKETTQQHETFVSPQEGKKMDLTLWTQWISDHDFIDLFVDIARKTPTTSSPYFRNQLFGWRVPEATMAEMLASFMNNSMYTYKVAWIQILIEKEVIAHMLWYVWFDEGDGIFNPGGSMSNLAAMICARNEKRENCKEQWIQWQKLVGYTSDQSHYSLAKNAGILGMGRESIRKIPSDEMGKMSVTALVAQMQDDIAQGYIPYFVNCTAGTTVLWMYDPIDEIIQATEEFDIWVHVDGSWWGSVVLSPQRQDLIAWSHKAHSFSRNPHKMMWVPLSSSALLVREKWLLYKHLGENADYLYQTDDDDLNLGNKSLQCGRRNDAFKIRAAWKKLGDTWYQKRIDTMYAMVDHAKKYIMDDPRYTLVLDSEAPHVCFTIEGQDVHTVCEKLYERSMLKVWYGNRQGQSFMRLICVNTELWLEGVDYFFETLDAFFRG